MAEYRLGQTVVDYGYNFEFCIERHERWGLLVPSQTPTQVRPTTYMYRSIWVPRGVLVEYAHDDFVYVNDTTGLIYTVDNGIDGMHMDESDVWVIYDSTYTIIASYLDGKNNGRKFGDAISLYIPDSYQFFRGDAGLERSKGNFVV